MHSYQVIRTHLSPYQSSDFALIEEASLQNIPGLSYRQMGNFDPKQKTILITNTHTKLSELPPALLKNTSLIVHPNSGYDQFSQEQSLWQNIPLVIGHTIRAQAVAEYTLSCLFQGITNLPQHLVWDKRRAWERFIIKDLSVWIFGYGHIGKILASTLNALGAKITIIDPYTTSDFEHYQRWNQGDLKKAQVVIAACSLNSTSEFLFNEDFFSNCSKDLLFINGARGKLVEENALRHFLKNHPDTFAFLDVFNEEPFNDQWLNFPQVWKTSHVAGVYKELDQKIIEFEKNVISDYLALKTESFHLKYKNELIQNKLRQGVLI